MHKTGEAEAYQCQPCTPALMVLGGLSFSVKTSEKPSIRSLMSSSQSWQHQKKPARDMCMQHLNLARNNNKAKKQCYGSFRDHSVFSWSKSIREGISDLLMQETLCCPCLSSPWRLSFVTGPGFTCLTEQQNRSRDSPGTPAHFRAVSLLLRLLPLAWIALKAGQQVPHKVFQLAWACIATSLYLFVNTAQCCKGCKSWRFPASEEILS